MVIIISALNLAACDTDSIMSVVDTSNQRVELVEKGQKVIQDVINSREQFIFDFASINDVRECKVTSDDTEKITLADKKEEAENLVKSFINFVSSEYKTVDNIEKLDTYLSEHITDVELRMYDWWGANTNQLSETWFVDTIAESEKGYTINTISRLKRNIDNEQKEVDIAVKWTVVYENGELRIASTNVVSLDEVKEGIQSILKGKTDMTIYKPTKSQGNEYSNIKNIDAKALKSVKEVYKDSVVAVLTDNNEGTGFILAPGYVVTTYDNIYKAKGIKVMFPDETEKNIKGIVYASKIDNVAVLKMTEKVGTAVELGKYSDIKDKDPVAIVGCAGTMIEHITGGNMTQKAYNEYDRMVMLVRAPITNDGLGSIVVNPSGKVVGMINYTNSTFKEMSRALSTAHLGDVSKYLKSTEWNSVKAISLGSMEWNKAEVEQEKIAEEAAETIK